MFCKIQYNKERNCTGILLRQAAQTAEQMEEKMENREEGAAKRVVRIMRKNVVNINDPDFEKICCIVCYY